MNGNSSSPTGGVFDKEPVQMSPVQPTSRQSLADSLPNGTPDDLLMMLGAKDAALSLRVIQMRQLEARIAQLEVELEKCHNGE